MQDPALTMASLDVDSLFTNIPLAETVDICCDLVFKGKMIVDGLAKEDLKELLTIATTESFILFDGEYYQQIDGVAMGSPLGPTLANIFLCHHEKSWLSQCPQSIKPVYYRRYVDDIFLLFKDANAVHQFQQYMNEQHRNMNFTSELEENNSLPFLDVHVHRDGNLFTTSVYRKPTFSGVYTHYSSYIPEIYKTGLLSTLLYRCYVICTGWSQIDTEIRTIRSFMLKNGYPSNILDRAIYKFLNNMRCNQSNSTNVDDSNKKQYMLVLPHLGSYTKKLEKKIKSAVKQHLANCKLTVVYRASTRLRSLFKFKDSIPSYLTSGIVYKYTCSRCNSTYVGESIRHAKRRYSEHLGISALSGKPLKGQNSTTVRDHILLCKPEASFEDFKVIGRDNTSKYNLRVKESLFIHKERPNINIQGNSIPLVLFTE